MLPKLQPSHVSAGSFSRCFVLLAFVACIAGCDSNPDRSRLVGRWDVVKADSLMEKVNASDSESGASEAPRMLVHFYGSGALMTQTNMGAVSTEKQGTWEFLSYDGEANIAKIECRLMDDTTEFEVVFNDENTIRMVPPNMAGLTQKLEFHRK